MYEVFNLGNARTVTLADMARSLAEVLELKAEYAILPERPGDLPQTYADIGKARSLLGYEPRTDFSSGLREFAAWLTGTRKLRRRAMQA